jgi:hypothetical protein
MRRNTEVVLAAITALTNPLGDVSNFGVLPQGEFWFFFSLRHIPDTSKGISCATRSVRNRSIELTARTDIRCLMMVVSLFFDDGERLAIPSLERGYDETCASKPLKSRR